MNPDVQGTSKRSIDIGEEFEQQMTPRMILSDDYNVDTPFPSDDTSRSNKRDLYSRSTKKKQSIDDPKEQNGAEDGDDKEGAKRWGRSQYVTNNGNDEDEDRTMASNSQTINYIMEDRCTRRIETLQENDILCNRGKEAFNHEGNRKFRISIATHLQDYTKATDRPGRAKIIVVIISQLLQSGARFLKLQSKNGPWYELGLRDAQGKVAHTLRDACTNRNKSIFTLHQERQRQISSSTMHVPRDGDGMDSELTSQSRQFDQSKDHLLDSSDNSCCSNDLDAFNEMSLSDIE